VGAVGPVVVVVVEELKDLQSCIIYLESMYHSFKSMRLTISVVNSFKFCSDSDNINLPN
jgi:hypothetical protein